MKRGGVALALPLVARPQSEEPLDPLAKLPAIELRELRLNQVEHLQRYVLVTDRRSFDCVEHIVRHQIVFVGLAGLLRTQLGGPFLARSRDEGETWSEPAPSGLEGPESCTCLRRIPGTNDLVLFWNHSKYIAEGHHHYGERTPLTAAVSRDGGQTWRVIGNLRDGPNDEYTNIDCTFTSDGKAIVTYLFNRPAWSRSAISLHATIVERSWFVAN